VFTPYTSPASRSYLSVSLPNAPTTTGSVIPINTAGTIINPNTAKNRASRNVPAPGLIDV
jgi:hypothetical protein